MDDSKQDQSKAVVEVEGEHESEAARERRLKGPVRGGVNQEHPGASAVGKGDGHARSLDEVRKSDDEKEPG